jgi:S-DNA-T family DNA segregation ATPase FtsK/SpoIIIE
MLTIDLLSLLNDLVLTASDEAGLAGCAGILLHTSRVDEGTEPGATNVLVGTSTNGTAIGHCWAEAGGDLTATLLPIQYVNALRVGLGKLLNKDNKATHITDLRRDGDEVVIAEDPDLFGGGFTQRFGAGDLDDWPRTAFVVLGTVHLTPPMDARPVENRTDFPSARLAPFLTIAQRHGGQISLYRVHQAFNVHVQVGVHYRGVLVPSGQWNDGSSAEGGGPDIGVYPADLPPIKTAEETQPQPANA